MPNPRLVSRIAVLSIAFICIADCIRDVPQESTISAKNFAKPRKWPDLTGYIPVTKDNASSLYYAYYEAYEPSSSDTPIILWLQGGPGCASTFGGLYEIGPWLVTDDLTLVENEGSWARRAGLLLVDQPVGTGLSIAASDAAIPRDEMGMAAHLYTALQGFFARYRDLARRPLFIVGESYGGKYVPSIAHYVLQASQRKAGGTRSTKLAHTRQLPERTTPPVFNLRGIAVGNGLTEPRAQTLALAGAAWSAGLVSSAGRDALAQLALQVVGLIDAGKWDEAHVRREALRAALVNASGLGTVFDTRRVNEYDPTQAVDRYLNLPEVREAMGARKGAPLPYTSCSEAVGRAMAGDTMRSVAHLLPDILAHLPVLLYQGQYDVLDGPASNTAWIEAMEEWPGAAELRTTQGTPWFTGEGG
eukprot:CAMPEP_0202860512 /NCGR_PEP_ID=MMETSP1391-20130828/2179_1 /ASSEMBLY_ACC=CAM_ASM_000867 /TAXON_ID=1034604 /ORGANISM="Chlamydomonas leiostraca, Strain SAG 11-49" /LENGTH=416 /DNA_ID=CAMNT_0049539683 /DNA_START=7 /DNA_END=1253 /DNA_ORIENTATION=+